MNYGSLKDLRGSYRLKQFLIIDLRKRLYAAESLDISLQRELPACQPYGNLDLMRVFQNINRVLRLMFLFCIIVQCLSGSFYIMILRLPWPSSQKLKRQYLTAGGLSFPSRLAMECGGWAVQTTWPHSRPYRQDPKITGHYMETAWLQVLPEICRVGSQPTSRIHFGFSAWVFTAFSLFWVWPQSSVGLKSGFSFPWIDCLNRLLNPIYTKKIVMGLISFYSDSSEPYCSSDGFSLLGYGVKSIINLHSYLTVGER